MSAVRFRAVVLALALLGLTTWTEPVTPDLRGAIEYAHTPGAPFNVGWQL